MSDTSQGEGWWIASDGKWYAPSGALPMPTKDKHWMHYERTIRPVLSDGEKMVDAVGGMAEVTRGGKRTRRRGTLFVTERRAGVLSKKMGGHDLTDFAFELLTSVEHKKGMRYGEITLLAPGSSIRFHQIDKGRVQAMAKLLRDSVVSAHGARHATPIPAVSTADEIAKLGGLLAQGLITDEEFAAHKAKLLP